MSFRESDLWDGEAVWLLRDDPTYQWWVEQASGDGESGTTVRVRLSRLESHYASRNSVDDYLHALRVARLAAETMGSVSFTGLGMDAIRKVYRLAFNDTGYLAAALDTDYQSVLRAQGIDAAQSFAIPRVSEFLRRAGVPASDWPDALQYTLTATDAPGPAGPMELGLEVGVANIDHRSSSVLPLLLLGGGLAWLALRR